MAGFIDLRPVRLVDETMTSFRCGIRKNLRIPQRKDVIAANRGLLFLWADTVVVRSRPSLVIRPRCRRFRRLKRTL